MTAALERLLEGDGLTSGQQVGDCQALLRVAGDPGPELAQVLGVVADRLRSASDSARLDLEGWVYPKLWKVIEAVRGGLPAGEQAERVALLARPARSPD